MNKSMPWWWLSFCDGISPKGQQFLGACLVRSWDMVGACRAAWCFGINPGGAVQGMELPGDAVIQDGWEHRLLSREECVEFDRLHSAPKPYGGAAQSGE